MRRIALVLVAASVLSLGVTAGPAFAAKKPAKITDCKKDKSLNANITKAFDTYLSGDTTDQQMSLVEKGDVLKPIAEESAAATKASGQSPKEGFTTLSYGVKAACDGKKAATFSYDLSLGVPKPVTGPATSGAGLSFKGDAVLDAKKGVWLVSAATLCDLWGAGNKAIGDKCLAAAG